MPNVSIGVQITEAFLKMQGKKCINCDLCHNLFKKAPIAKLLILVIPATRALKIYTLLSFPRRRESEA
jgi:hypothetical protein